MARALGVALSGPRSYHGTQQEFPYVNVNGHRDIGATEIEAACRALWRTWGAALALVAVLTLLV